MCAWYDASRLAQNAVLDTGAGGAACQMCIRDSSATILVFGGFQVSQLAMGQQTSSLGVAVAVQLEGGVVLAVIIAILSAVQFKLGNQDN